MPTKKLIAVVLMAMVLFMTGCGDTKKINGVTYDTYGLLSPEKHNPNIEYEVIWGNVFLGVLLVETIIAPVYFFGFSLFEPVQPVPAIPGSIQQEKKGV